jgi:DNA-binding CsgD family transcriptional regulator
MMSVEIRSSVGAKVRPISPPDVDVDLAPRELQVLQLIADGKSTKQIAGTLHLSESTVKTHLRTLFDKLGASHRAHAVALAIRYHLID